MAATEVKMKLMIDTNSNKVLFAQVGKECVDFLFHILSLPIGTVIRLLNKKDMVGSVANLYVSIEHLNQTYLQPNQTKDMLLQPKLPVSSASIPLLALTDNVPITQKTFYRCNNNNYNYDYNRCCLNVSDGPNACCPSCKSTMTTQLTYVAPPVAKTLGPSEGGGIVKGVVTYMVMDNLEVKPMSTISSIALLNQFNVKNVCALQEKTVILTMDKVYIKALRLLKLSFKSSTVLTDVFLG